MLQKHRKPGLELFKMIQKSLGFVLEVFLKRWKSGLNRPKW